MSDSQGKTPGPPTQPEANPTLELIYWSIYLGAVLVQLVWTVAALVLSWRQWRYYSKNEGPSSNQEKDHAQDTWRSRVTVLSLATAFSVFMIPAACVHLAASSEGGFSFPTPKGRAHLCLATAGTAILVWVAHMLFLSWFKIWADTKAMRAGSGWNRIRVFYWIVWGLLLLVSIVAFLATLPTIIAVGIVGLFGTSWAIPLMFGAGAAQMVFGSLGMAVAGVLLNWIYLNNKIRTEHVKKPSGFKEWMNVTFSPVFGKILLSSSIAVLMSIARSIASLVQSKSYYSRFVRNGCDLIFLFLCVFFFGGFLVLSKTKECFISSQKTNKHSDRQSKNEEELGEKANET
eukprot:gb/GECH01000321.1/.p1 GENE.gb/GECH01000321.1/~~gb/GECH01000321.1/.p1  ORF type:complete len:345 (+),score=38.78 gb/GECH01000321.1/:1-1035(+)